MLSTDDAPVGSIRAISGETIYVDHVGDLVALREETDTDDQPDDTDGGNDEEDGSDEQDDQQDGEDDSDDEDECPCLDDDPADDNGGSSGVDGESVDADNDDVGNGNAGSGDAENETDTENNSDADNVPGFTAGGGLLGGALGLEWLRWKAGVDESPSDWSLTPVSGRSSLVGTCCWQSHATVRPLR